MGDYRASLILKEPQKKDSSHVPYKNVDTVLKIGKVLRTLKIYFYSLKTTCFHTSIFLYHPAL